MSDTRKPAKSTSASDKAFGGFTDEERAAMKEHAQELKAAARRGPRAAKADGESDLLEKIAEMFKTRYATFGFNDVANLDEGAMWPVTFALTELTAANEARIGALVKKAAG